MCTQMKNTFNREQAIRNSSKTTVSKLEESETYLSNTGELIASVYVGYGIFIVAHYTNGKIDHYSFETP
jgi:hypothetical protein